MILARAKVINVIQTYNLFQNYLEFHINFVTFFFK